jgi:hypothetical protein
MGGTSGTHRTGQANKLWPENTKGREKTNNLKMYLKIQSERMNVHDEAQEWKINVLW